MELLTLAFQLPFSKTTSGNGSGGNSGGGSVRASYTPWSSESDDRSSGSGTAVMGITAPPQAYSIHSIFIHYSSSVNFFLITYSLPNFDIFYCF